MRPPQSPVGLRRRGVGTWHPSHLVGFLAEIHSGDSWGVEICIVDLSASSEAASAGAIGSEVGEPTVFQKEVRVRAGEELNLAVRLVQGEVLGDGQWWQGPGAPLAGHWAGEEGQGTLDGGQRGCGSTDPVHRQLLQSTRHPVLLLLSPAFTWGDDEGRQAGLRRGAVLCTVAAAHRGGSGGAPWKETRDYGGWPVLSPRRGPDPTPAARIPVAFGWVTRGETPASGTLSTPRQLPRA